MQNILAQEIPLHDEEIYPHRTRVKQPSLFSPSFHSPPFPRGPQYAHRPEGAPKEGRAAHTARGQATASSQDRTRQARYPRPPNRLAIMRWAGRVNVMRYIHKQRRGIQIHILTISAESNYGKQVYQEEFHYENLNRK